MGEIEVSSFSSEVDHASPAERAKINARKATSELQARDLP